LAKEARDYIRQKLASAGRIELKDAQRDKYFRILARVIADGEDIGQLQLANGFAVSYHGGMKVKDWCAPAIGEPQQAPEPLPLSAAP
jgi:micrococcal nuclease